MVIVKGGKPSALSQIKRAVIPLQFVGGVARGVGGSGRGLSATHHYSTFSLLKIYFHVMDLI